MYTIAVISLEQINNAGEEILRVTTSSFFKNENISVKRVEIDPKHEELCAQLNVFTRVIYKSLRKISVKIFKEKNYHLKNMVYKTGRKKYYKNALKGADAAVYALGMLKFKTQDISFLFNLINKEAEKLNIPVMMSAMSIAPPDESDWRYHQLVKAVNRSSVKMITTRDGTVGLERLRKYYIQNDNINTRYVGDPALWIPDCYNVKRSGRRLIGINLIRNDIYRNYGKKLSPEQLTEFYMGLISELNKRELDWVLFCNGIKSDYKFGLELIEKMHLDPQKLLRCPHSADELINDVAGFGVILGARLHACITAVSLGVPVVGLLWDDKLVYFSETMKLNDYFIDEDNMDSVFAADLIQKAFKSEIDMDNVSYYKNMTSESFHDFVKMLP